MPRMDYSTSEWPSINYMLTCPGLIQLRYRIDAITLFAVPSNGPHGFHALGRYVSPIAVVSLVS